VHHGGIQVEGDGLQDRHKVHQITPESFQLEGANRYRGIKTQAKGVVKILGIAISKHKLANIDAPRFPGKYFLKGFSGLPVIPIMGEIIAGAMERYPGVVLLQGHLHQTVDHP
jgi:hypothetical protein